MFWESSIDSIGDKSIIRYIASAIRSKDSSGLDKILN
jgi:hypothetical protein